LCAGCSYEGMSIERQRVSKTSLASSFVRSPDPLQSDPPTGERLWIDWSISPTQFEENLILTLRVIYNSFEVERIAYPVNKRSGQVSFSLLGEKYKKSGGIFTYRADIDRPDGTVVESWVQQMWYDPI